MTIPEESGQDNRGEMENTAFFGTSVEIFDHLVDAAMVIGKDYKVLYLNKAARDFYHIKGDALGRRCYEIAHRRDRPCHFYAERCPVKDAFENKEGVRILQHYVGHENKEELHEVTASPLFDKSGEVQAVIKMVRGLEYVGLLEKSLQREKERLEETQANMRRQHRELKGVFKQVEKAKEEWERTLDCIGDMVMLVSPRDRVLRCNKAVPEFFGLSYEQLLSKNWEDILLGHGMQTNYARGKAIELFHGPTGKWFLLNIYDYGKDKHDATKFVITLHETTRLKHIASELSRKNAEIEENQKKLEVALEEISSLIEKVTEGQAVVRFEYPSAGSCWEMMNCRQTGCPCYGRKSRRCWEEAGAFCREGFCTAGDDNQRTQCSFYTKANGDPIYQIGNQFNNMMDILETKNRELGDAYKELKATQAQILQQEKMASIGQLAAGVAHELNNPLGFISSNLSTLQKYLARLIEFIATQSQLIQVDDRGSVSEARSRLKIDYILEDTVNLIKESLEGADRLKKIIQDLKSFSRVDQAQLTHANIIECIESTVNIVWNELKYKANVVKDYGELPLTKCYPQQLNQVFMNLLVNASQAIEKQGEIGIKAWCEHDSIFVAISDTGYGIPQENIKRIFEPFFTTKEVGKGTGLGLSITFDIIKKHHGEISVESEVGKGTTFTVKIPVVEGQ